MIYYLKTSEEFFITCESKAFILAIVNGCVAYSWYRPYFQLNYTPQPPNKPQESLFPLFYSPYLYVIQFNP